MLFQFFHPLLGRGSQNSLLNSVEQIVYGFLRFGVLHFEQRQSCIFGTLQPHNRIRQNVNQLIIKNNTANLRNHKIFYPFFSDSFLIATFMIFNAHTFIIAMHFILLVTRSAFSYHKASALSAKQFRRQQIFVFCFVFSRSFFICRHTFLHTIK